MKVFNCYTVLFLLALSSSTIAIADTEFERKDCQILYASSAQESNFSFECSIILSFNPSYNYSQHHVYSRPEFVPTIAKVNCQTFENHKAIIVHVTQAVSNYTFRCTSTHQIYRNVQFHKGIIQSSYLKMKTERVVTNMSDIATYSYQLSVFPPTSGIWFSECDAAKYDFFTAYRPLEKIKVLWFSQASTMFPSDAKLCWMGNTKSNIPVMKMKGNILKLPCIASDTKSLSLRYKFEKISVNNDTVSYDPFEGFILESSQVIITPNTTYNCYIPGKYAQREGDYIEQYFIIKSQFTKKRGFYISAHLWHLANGVYPLKLPFVEAYNFDTIEDKSNNVDIYDFHNSRYNLNCSNNRANVTLFYSYDANNMEVPDTANVSYSTYNTTTSIINSAQYTTNPPQFGWNAVFICEQQVPKRSQVNWVIHRTGIMSSATENYTPIHIHYQEKYNIFICVGDNSVSMAQIRCDNIYECRDMATYLHANISTRGIEKGILCYDFYDFQSEIPNEIEGGWRNARDLDDGCLIIKTSKSGLVQCSSKYGQVSYQEVYFVGFDDAMYLGLQENIDVSAILHISVENQTDVAIWPIPAKYVFHCEAHAFYFEHGTQWMWEITPGISTIIPKENIKQIPRPIMQDNKNVHSFVEIYLDNSTVRRVTCAAPLLSIQETKNQYNWKYVSKNITLLNILAPKFSEDEPYAFSFNIGDSGRTLKCKAEGFPKPEIKWSRNGQDLSSDFIIADHFIYTSLQFPNYHTNYSGEYICTATNIGGNISKVFTVHTVAETSAWSHNFQIYMPAIAIFVLTLVFMLVFITHRRSILKAREYEMKDVLEMLSSAPRITFPDISETPQGDNVTEEYVVDPVTLPYDASFEMEKHSFAIDRLKILGHGEFGTVYKGRIASLELDVAFKTVNSSCSLVHLKSLVSELKILMYLGNHKNIVQLLGAYTKEVRKGILYIALEFCALGSLLSFLKANRGRFQECRYLNLRCRSSPETGRKSKGLEDTHSVHSIKNLWKWCYEIASAMEYLGEKKVIHSDLAARNILLTSDCSAKLTDFGLSRRTYYESQYLKKGNEPLPWRWLALESLNSHIFTVKSDVWAYAIVLWEIFSLGEVPYPEVLSSTNFVSLLEDGMRNRRPKYACNRLYQVMIQCWNSDADERPFFSQLKHLFEKALENNNYELNTNDIDSLRRSRVCSPSEISPMYTTLQIAEMMED